MICKLGGFITQRHNELRDLEAEFLSMMCNDVGIEPVLQDISGEHLNRGSNKAQDARLDIHARGFWDCLLYTSPSPRDLSTSRMPSSA